MTDADPGFVLSGLDRAFAATEGDEQLTTLVYAVIDPATARLRLSSAGHPPLLLLPADGGPPRYLDEVVVGTPLGLPEARVGVTVRLSPGDTLLGYTDGLFVGRDRDLDDSLASIAAAADEGRGLALARLVEHLTTAVLGAEPRDDDVTVIAVRLGAAGPG
jgi:serine phosphatase RsbU (regulator of sigma subunit)